MKKLTLSLLAIVLTSLSLCAQQFEVQSIFVNGDPSERINLVFLSDGYTEAEMPKYLNDVNTLIGNIFNQSPFQEYQNYFNAYAIKVPSAESGAVHPRTSPDSDCLPVPVKATVDNYFGSTFDAFNIHRLLVPVKTGTIGSVLADNFPEYDQVFVLVNSPYYGGSGGSFATSSSDNSASEVAIHEIGHSFAGLSDEYWAGPQYADEKPNMTQQGNVSLVKWASWINTNDISTYPFSENPSWYRPHQNCKMRFLNVPFCSVCRETFVERIHNLVDPFISFSPTETTINIQEGRIDFSVELLKPDPNTFKITWIRNGDVLSVGQNEEELSLSVNSLQTGTNTIKVQMIDTTTLTRNGTHFLSHIYEVTWTVDTDNVTGVEIHSARAEYEIEIFPNPVTDQLNVSYTLSKNADVNIDLTGSDGKQLKTLVDEHQKPGTYTYSFQPGQVNMNTSGLYYLTLRINGSTLVEKLIRK
jgi:hypothetical protein